MDISGYEISLSKHFVKTWMRKWNIDVYNLRNAIEIAYKIEKVGKYKYEAYIKTKNKGIKLIFIKDDEDKEILIITGAEGK